MSVYKKGKSVPRSEKTPDLSALDPLIDSKRTTGNGWHLKCTLYPSGDCEVMALKLDPETSLKRGGGGRRKVADKGQMDSETLKKSQCRSRRVVYQRILTLNADTLLTLTYRDNQTDLQQAWKDFRSFSKLMKKRYGDRWQYICVPERQERGAIHFHLAIRGYYHWNTVRSFWRQVVGEGNVDFKRRKDSKGKYVVNPKRIARYLSKYLTKQDMVEFNKRRYSSSSIQLPTPMIGWLAIGVPLVPLLTGIVKKLTRKPVQGYWEKDGFYPIAMVFT